MPSNKIIAFAFIFFGLLGFLDATYLTISHYRHVIPPCSVVHGCEQVLTSSYATIVGIPMALIGALYYLSILLCALASVEMKREQLLLLTARLTGVGMAASLYFLALQIFVIHSYCLYCLGSVATSTLLFIAARFFKKTKPQSAQSA